MNFKRLVLELRNETLTQLNHVLYYFVNILLFHYVESYSKDVACFSESGLDLVSSSNWLQPYLHESRHRHALNRVRGSGGRFLSTKQLQQSSAEVANGAHSGSDANIEYQKKDGSEVESHPSRTGENASSITTCSDWRSLSSNSVNRQPERVFLANAANMSGASQCSGTLNFGGTKQRAPVVR